MARAAGRSAVDEDDGHAVVGQNVLDELRPPGGRRTPGILDEELHGVAAHSGYLMALQVAPWLAAMAAGVGTNAALAHGVPVRVLDLADQRVIAALDVGKPVHT